jgi:hypothetical protein
MYFVLHLFVDIDIFHWIIPIFDFVRTNKHAIIWPTGEISLSLDTIGGGSLRTS